METMTISKAKNILFNKKLNYWDMYHAKYINSSDKIVAQWNTSEMYELESEDYAEDYTEQEIKALKRLSNYYCKLGNDLMYDKIVIEELKN